MPYQIKENVIFRVEMNNFIILSPTSKKMMIFSDKILNIVNEAGQFVDREFSDEEYKIIHLFEKEGII